MDALRSVKWNWPSALEEIQRWDGATIIGLGIIGIACFCPFLTERNMGVPILLAFFPRKEQPGRKELLTMLHLGSCG